MQSPEETSETSEQVNETESVSETSETDNQTDEVKNYVSGIFNSENRALETSDTSLPVAAAEETEDEEDTSSDEGEQAEETTEEDSETEEETEEETESDESEVTGETTDNDLLELNVEGEIEKFSLKDDSQRKKLIEYAQKGRFLEKERAKDSADKKQFNQLAQSVAYQVLYNQMQGKISNDDFIEKPYDHFIGTGENETEDLKLWNEHKQTVRQNQANLNEYASRHKKMAESYSKLVMEFKSKHPEVSEPEKWIEENLSPYHAPIFTYGAVEYPADTIEMVYFYKNKDKIIKEAVEKSLRDHIKKPVKKVVNQSSAVKKTDAVNTIPTQKIFNPDNRQLVH